MIISDYSHNYSHWNAKKSLSGWMKEHKIPGIYGIDSRELTRKLRKKGINLLKKINPEVDKFITDYSSALNKKEKETLSLLCEQLYANEIKS